MRRLPLLLLAASIVVSPAAGAEITAGQSVSFGRHTPALGDGVEQTVGVEMRLRTEARRGAEVLEEAEVSLERRQRREVTATEIVGGRVVAARVRFHEARTTRNGQLVEEPVLAKVYHCRRNGESLSITTEGGQIPPMEEYTVVARAMETLGTPSPLAAYLAGKRVVVGEEIDLPADVARRALGFDDRLGSVERFRLRLDEIVSTGGGRVARFAAEIEAAGGGSGQMRLVIEGPLAIDESSCRIVSAELAGPIGMMQSRGGLTGGYQVGGGGRLSVATSSRYRDVPR